MFWKKCDIEFYKESGNDVVKIIGNDVFTNAPYCVYIRKENYDMLLSGKGINESLKGYDFTIKNFIANGIAPKTDSVFVFQRKVIRRVYVTNATANSVAFYAWLYINKCTEDKESLEDVKSLFVTQSKAFLAIYTKLLSNPDELIKQLNPKEIEKYFQHVQTKDIPRQFFRKIYHTKLECEYMRKAFDEGDKYFANTGVFYEKNILNNGASFYCLDEDYLQELDMRECKICEKIGI